MKNGDSLHSRFSEFGTGDSVSCPARKYCLYKQHRGRCKRDLAMAFMLFHSLVASDDSGILRYVGEIVACSFCLE